ncbi:MAG: arsenite methyltransferase [Bacteroidales bacterium]|jgi:SAM-dependent methyltransferase
MKTKDIKQIVQEKYGKIAMERAPKSDSSCCGTSSCCCDSGFSMIGNDYSKLEGYNPDADLGLGCGIPTHFASIKEGDDVLDLGSGAGNDCFVARAIVGETGSVTGLDFTQEMIDKATANNKKRGFTNIKFVKGDIEDMPIPDNNYDVVVSNCVLNLVPDKNKAFAQIMRVLKPDGHFCVSDVVIKGDLTEKIREDAELYVGCVSGAITIEKYLEIINNKGFKNITIHKQNEIVIPEEFLGKYMNKSELKSFKADGSGIYSITVSASK